MVQCNGIAVTGSSVAVGVTDAIVDVTVAIAALDICYSLLNSIKPRGLVTY